MDIQNVLTITELSRLLNRSRPSIYKYISDHDKGNKENIPQEISILFDKIKNGEFHKKDIYAYCYDLLYVKQEEDIKEIIDLLKENKEKINLNKIKELITKEISDEK